MHIVTVHMVTKRVPGVFEVPTTVYPNFARIAQLYKQFFVPFANLHVPLKVNSKRPDLPCVIHLDRMSL